ncbi:hypothetical protein KAM347_25180 [Aeromonas caviae]|uniref:Uncharacterized protein n=1 Tax=Aeromonas caviae TaxID=648 RepID=A0AAV4YL32_AERCA|nr:hypothetical protein KAM341_23950 [Aeromonas caviae]GJA37155.1 hypothetical protein KAM342_23980 [Aeromonas caviae]GJA41673.1 hypothetical protein KAM343_24690 [Aeromonas caviae]GJA50727.1 hypothetical protein KAM347_25180 [Aeromonas caviae]GJA59665.1 hypothetical protein KAM350_26580 [Aeromonas caviae]
MKPWCKRQWVTPAGTSMRSAIPNKPAPTLTAKSADKARRDRACPPTGYEKRHFCRGGIPLPDPI